MMPSASKTSTAIQPAARKMSTNAAANAAFVYSGGNYSTQQHKLMGRMSASESFLKGFARFSGVDRFYCYAMRQQDLEEFTRRVQEIAGTDRPVTPVSPLDLSSVGEPGCLYRPGPNIGYFAWQRRIADQRRFSICGVTHTTAEHVVMDGIAEAVAGPTQAWDALVCTSTQVRAMVERLVDQWSHYLCRRFGGKDVRAPFKLPLIPLGVDCDNFQPTAQRKHDGQALRKKLGITPDDIVVLFVGRLTHVEKANPLPMYLALEAAARRTKKKLHLLQAGWYASAEIEKIFVDAAKRLMPSVRYHPVDAREPEYRWSAWHAGDIFTSLSDNIQETFGLTPIEAQAAGLPVVVSDWDGYRDTVIDGEVGFAAPTFMPPPGSGADLGLRYATSVDSYGRYCMTTAQSISVDVEYCAQAYLKLIEDPALRRRMGEAGLSHARAKFDWRMVIAAYQSLWQELGELRRSAPETVALEAGRPAHPLRDDPFSLFSTYPTGFVDGETLATAAPGGNRQRLSALRATSLANLMPGLLLPEADLAKLLELVARSPSSVAQLLARAPEPKRNQVRRSLGWLAKIGLVRFTKPPA
jgi:glycosyltransferase involved in cell wall biosynthesis